MENNLCNKCGECCKKIAVDFQNRVVYRNGVEPLTSELEECLQPIGKQENITFCACKYLKDNLCTHPQKPEACFDFPSSPFAFLPDECGYYGEVFLKQESLKQKIRKFKEEIIHYETLIQTDKSVLKIIEHHKGFIDKYKIYGSYNW